MTQLIVLRGLPGCGKTAIAKVLAPALHATLVSSDELRFGMFESPTYTKQEHQLVFDAFHVAVAEALMDHQNVIADATHLRQTHLTPLKAIAESWDAEYHSFWVHTLKPVRLERLVARETSIEALRALVVASASMERGIESWGSIAINGGGTILDAVKQILVATGHHVLVQDIP